MKTLKKLTLALFFMTNFSFGYIAYIGVHGGYRSFRTSSGFISPPLFGPISTIFLGDTIRFYNYYAVNYTNVGDNLHTMTSFQTPPNGSPFDLNFDSRDVNLTVDLVPDDTGLYKFKCIFHDDYPIGSHIMRNAFYVAFRPSTVCGNRFVNGRTCTGINGIITFNGVVQNCQCTTTTSPPTTNTGCSNGLVENTTCTGIGTCTSCTGIVQSCMCITSTTGIKPKPKIEEDGGVLYPNPADEYVVVPLRQGLKYNIYVYDQNGKEIMYKRVEYQTEAKIDISSIRDGNYVVQLKYCACSTPKEGCQGANKTYKFIKINK